MERPRRIKLVVGTRGSQLAVIQTEQVLQALEARWADLKCEMKIIKTRGDDEKAAIDDVRAGRKGLFTGAIERALMAGGNQHPGPSGEKFAKGFSPQTRASAGF